MTTQLYEARERLHNQVLDATTLPEIVAARQALRDWIRAHPEDEWLLVPFLLSPLVKIAGTLCAETPVIYCGVVCSGSTAGVLTGHPHPL
ncbi:MAG TPA: hypothetical protein VFB38_09805 [Chthonomonadaceae bacterium]|nr:hypothetical protein [Chthonomonadaceae bacterium]